jgi:hypothetical protein
MARRKKPEKLTLKGKRLLMHPFHLQGLYDAGFVRIANQVLQGRLTLLSFRDGLSTEPAASAEAN